MKFLKIAKYLFWGTLLFVFLGKIINISEYYKIFISSFGFVGALILFIIGKAARED